MKILASVIALTIGLLVASPAKAEPLDGHPLKALSQKLKAKRKKPTPTPAPVPAPIPTKPAPKPAKK